MALLNQSDALSTALRTLKTAKSSSISGIISRRSGSSTFSLIMLESFWTPTPVCYLPKLRGPSLMQMDICSKDGSDVMSTISQEMKSNKRLRIHSDTLTVISSSKSWVTCRSELWSNTSRTLRRNMDPFLTMSGPKMNKCLDSELLNRFKSIMNIPSTVIDKIRWFEN